MYRVQDWADVKRLHAREGFSTRAIAESLCMADHFGGADRLRASKCETGTGCYAGALMLQAMGLGGWMFDGAEPFLCWEQAEIRCPGLRFRNDTGERWPYLNPTGREGVMEGFCPPHDPGMRAPVEAKAC